MLESKQKEFEKIYEVPQIEVQSTLQKYEAFNKKRGHKSAEKYGELNSTSYVVI